MDEIDSLRTLGSDVPAPDPRVRRAARAGLLAHAQTAPLRPRWTATRWLGVRRTPIAAAVAAVALVAIVGSGLMSRPDPAAAAALNRAADVAAAQPASSGDGYRHTKSEGAYLSGVAGGPDRPDGIWALVPVEREIWIGPDGSGRLVESRGEPIWFGPADEAAWVAASSPDLRGGQDSDTRFGPTPSGAEPGASQPWPGSLHYEDLDVLPTDVESLRTVIDARAAAGGGANDYERFTVVADLLRETVGTPDLRASLYRVAAGLGGVELIGSMTDRAGRTGVGVAMTGNPSGVGLERHTLIFDPDTSTLLAEETVLLESVDWLDADPPTVIGYNTYLVSDIAATIP